MYQLPIVCAVILPAQSYSQADRVARIGGVTPIHHTAATKRKISEGVKRA